MSLIQDLVEWASSGDVSPAYDDAKKALGWVVGEPPSAPGWNEVENARDKMINRVKTHTEALGTLSPNADKYDLCAQLFASEDWSDPGSHINMGLSLALESSEVRDACVAWDNVENKPLVLVLLVNGTLHRLNSSIAGNSVCWQYGPSIGHSEITLTFPSTPDQVEAVACDGNYLFVAWSVDSDYHYVTAFSVNDLEGAAAWTRDTTIAKAGGSDEVTKMIVASSTALAIQVQDGAGGAGSARTTAVINKANGALIGTGGGSYAAGYGDDCNPRCRPISDGTHIFWIGYQTVSATRTFYLMSLKLSAPATSDYASKEIATGVTTTDTWDHPRCLALSNGRVFVFTSAGAIGRYTPSSDAWTASYGMLPSTIGPTREGNQDALMCFDGLNYWFLGTNTDDTPSVRYVLHGIPQGYLTGVGVDGHPITAVSRTVPLIPASGTYPDIEEDATNIGGRLLFDGRDLWCILRDATVFRIANPGGR